MYSTSYDLWGTFRGFCLSHGRYSKYFAKYMVPGFAELRKTASLRGSKKGKKCFIFATGTSITLLDPEKIKKYKDQGFDVFCINRLMITDFVKTCPPSHYVLSDPGFFNPYPQTVPNHLKWNDDSKNLFRNLKNAGIPVFLPIQFREKKAFEDSYFFNDYENLYSHNIDLLKPRGYRSNTSNKALAVACFLGYDKIYIGGMDNDSFKHLRVSKDNRLSVWMNHFYDPEFKGDEISVPEYERGVSDFLWDSHLAFKDLFLFRDQNIINLDPDSLIDVFPKNVDLDVYQK